MKNIGLIASMLLIFAQTGIARADFTRSSAGVVADSVTKLEWQDIYYDDSSQETDYIKGSFNAAINYCQDLTLEGGGWRLPNINELKTLVVDTQYEPSIDEVFLKIDSSVLYWSSTQLASGYRKFGIFFTNGAVSSLSIVNNIRNVRCVRDGS